MQYFSFRAQGTMEYLVIIAIVVVISLVVVGMSGALVSDSGGQVASTTTDLSSKTGSSSGGIAVVESATDSIGNGLIKLNNFTGQGLSLTKISTVSPDGSLVDNNFDSIYIGSFDGLAFSLEDLEGSCSCSTGETKKSCTFVIEYTSTSGLEKSQSVTTNVACVSAISSSGVVINPAFDLLAPVVLLASPVDDYSTETALVDFNFFVSDNNVVSQCVLVVGGVDVNTIALVTNNAYNLISYSLSLEGDNVWNVRCTDYYGNSATSVTSRNITYTGVLSFSAEWAQNPVDGSGAGSDSASSVVVDSNGNVYVAGSFSSTTISFGGVGNDVNLTNRGGTYDFFVVKYDSSGLAQWARGSVSGSGAGTDQANSVVVDSNGNVYVAGYFGSNTLGFGGTNNDVNLTACSIGDYNGDFFVVKYDSSGLAQWARNPVSGSGTSSDKANSVVVDSNGNVYVVGYFYSTTLSFGGVGNDVNLTNRGTNDWRDFFIVKYDSSGVAEWAKNPVSGGGINDELGQSVVVDSSGNVYVGGSFSSTTLGFGGVGNDVNLTNRGSFDFFVVKYDSSGVAEWARGPVSGSSALGADFGQSIAVDSSGNVYVAGYFGTALGFSGGIILGFSSDINLTSRYHDDFFVVKYNSSGVAEWSQNPVSGGGESNEYGYSVVVDSDGGVYVAGYGYAIGFGGVGNDVNLINCGGSDFFVVKYDSSGVAEWAKGPVSGSGAGTDSAGSVAVDSSDSVYVTGYSDSTTLGFGGVGNDVNLTNRGSFDFFVVKYSYN